MRIAVIGLGVMGGSFAARFREMGHHVYGSDLNPETIQYALENGIIDEGGPDPDTYLKQADLVLLCLYPTRLSGWLEEHQEKLRPGTLIMEISGVKGNITAPLQEQVRKDLQLLSIHPMCGRESKGIRFSTPRIFDGANFIIVPQPTNTFESVAQASALAKELGCGTISVLSPDEHDEMIAFLSQLTHVIAVSLMNTHENSHLVAYTGDSFRDLTRIAKINEDMWAELFLLNKEKLLEEISDFEASIAHFKEALESEDADEMRRLFIQSTERRKAFDR